MLRIARKHLRDFTVQCANRRTPNCLSVVQAVLMRGEKKGTVSLESPEVSAEVIMFNEI